MFANQTRFHKAAWFVFAGALLLRLYRLDLPFLEPYNSLTRQVVSGMMSRNFYLHGFRFWYPELDQGAGPYLFNAEMPIGPYIAALLYALTGGVHEWADRLVSVCASMALLGFLYAFAKRAYGAPTALWTLVFAAFSPLGVAFSRAAQPDMLMLAGSAGGLYFFYLYFEMKKTRYFVFSALMTFLAVASKAYTLYLFLPLLVMAWSYQGKKAISDPKNYFYAAFVLTTLVWYGYMWNQGKTQALYYDTIQLNRGVPFKKLSDLFSMAYFGLLGKIFFAHILTLSGTILFFIGFLTRSGKKEDRFFYAWFAAVAFFLMVTWRIVLRNPYYELALLPPAAVFMGRGFAVLRPRFFLAAVLLAAFLFNGLYFYRGLYFLPPERQALLAVGAAAERYTEPDKLVIASYEASPALLYYCNRRGWEFDASRGIDVLAADLEKKRDQGARFFVTPLGYLSKVNPVFEAYLRGRFGVVHEAAGHLILDLEKGAV